jgi:hypothetical protein
VKDDFSGVNAMYSSSGPITSIEMEGLSVMGARCELVLSAAVLQNMYLECITDRRQSTLRGYEVVNDIDGGYTYATVIPCGEYLATAGDHSWLVLRSDKAVARAEVWCERGYIKVERMLAAPKRGCAILQATAMAGLSSDVLTATELKRDGGSMHTRSPG